MVLRIMFAAAFLLATFAHAQSTDNDGIHLAIGPTCGSADGNTTDVNQGLLSGLTYETIVSFGDSYTAGGIANGSALLPPVLTGTSPKAGGRTTNGPVWIEDIANDVGALFMDYAVGGAVTNVSLWPSKSTADDFLEQMALFLGQNHTLDPETTLYTVFFGINDWSAAATDGDKLPQAAQCVLDQIAILASPPTNGRNFLVTDDYGRGTEDAKGDAYKQQIFDGLRTMKNADSTFNYAFADFAYLWNAVLGPDPGFEAFGYTSDGACTLNSSTVIGACDMPNTTFYWIPGHPSKETHRIMGDYVELVAQQC